MTTPQPAQAGHDTRPLLFIGAGVLALVIISVAVVLLLGRGAATEFPADSPEGAFQRYLAAYEDGDYETAYGYFSEGVQGQMSLEDYRQGAQMHGGGMGFGRTSQRVLFQDTEGDDDRVRLNLVVEYFYGEGMQGGSDRYPLQVSMIREDGEWRIDDPLVGFERYHGPF
ncbi:MAG TPA: hypothetical protein VMP86_05870 [Candidatus Binatia bacterium]|nr:hypothetical protein [Candidatus Binatia bacterium]